ncbi:MAG: signal peptidase [Solirubrobacterales bacterium]|nr:signal peptidase [Solirubrobacterales bacterium]
MKNPFTREPEPKAEKTAGGQLVELVVIVAIALGLALGIQAFLVKPYRIPSPSMVPTLKVGQRVLVNRIGNNFNDPEVGEIVVFHPPAPADQGAGGKGPSGQCGVDYGGGKPCPAEASQEAKVNFIKRVVAGPGDTIAIRGGHVILNGVSQADKEKGYIAPCGPGGDCDFPTAITVPPDHWYMMGDNRGQSDDSRFWGPVPKKWIIGGAFATYWPPSRIGLL